MVTYQLCQFFLKSVNTTLVNLGITLIFLTNFKQGILAKYNQIPGYMH